MSKQRKNLDHTSDVESMQQKDDALFEALGKSRKNKKRKILRTVLIIICVIALLLVAGVTVLQRRVRSQFAASAEEVLSYSASRGTISTVVSGSGMLQNVDTEVIELISGVELEEVFVSYGDTVAAGDLLASADMATVRTAMADLQTQIEELDDAISDAEDDKVSNWISAGVSGRVKQIYAEVGEEVSSTMVEHGALALLSLDGYMAVQIETDQLVYGDSVNVIRENGEEIIGEVTSASTDKAIVLVSDDGPMNDELVQIVAENGETIGSGNLYIHNPLAITGYAGTVSRVGVKENQKVYSSTTVFSLTDTNFTANYNSLLRTRGEAEETLRELLSIQKYGGITAPIAGSIYSVVDPDAQESEEITEVASISPDISMSVTITIDESDILSLQLGQEADITVRSLGDETLHGIVTEIDKTASSGSYTAVITLDKIEGMLPGMTASVDVRIDGVDNAILIPTEALHQTSSGYYVYTAYDEELQEYGGRVDVVPGLSNSNYVEIKSGLNEGDTVYYTEEEDFFSAMGFGGMGGMPGEMPNMGGGSMPNFGGNGGSRPDFGGGGMPGGMPGRG